MEFKKTTGEELLHEELVAIPAYLTAVEDAGEGTYGPQLKWVFLDEEGNEPWGWTGANLTPRAKFGKWVTALTGGIPDMLDTEDLLGPCNLVFERFTRDDGTVGEKIITVKPRTTNKKDLTVDQIREATSNADTAPF